MPVPGRYATLAVGGTVGIFVCVTALAIASVLAGTGMEPLVVVLGLAAPTVTSIVGLLRAEIVRAEVRGLSAVVRHRPDGE